MTQLDPADAGLDLADGGFVDRRIYRDPRILEREKDFKAYMRYLSLPGERRSLLRHAERGARTQ